ncbi:MAG: NADH-quinone oxidoreductase subunit J [Ignavibacteriaceae bacterium]|nr:NADH-quinone oxidoreductase subunit J [Ignavibacteriaceae bacterium]
MTIAFYIASLVAIISTIMVITRLNAVHALLYLIVSLLSVAVIFFILGAHFVAALEVIVYAGAIMVLFIFVVMMLNLGKESENSERKLLSSKMLIGPGILVLILLIEFITILSSSTSEHLFEKNITPAEVGISLFTKYLLGVELTAMLLMVGIVGSYHIGRRKKKVLHRFLQEKEEAQ